MYRQTTYKKFAEENIWPYVSIHFALKNYNAPIPIDLKPFNDMVFINLLGKKAVLLKVSVDNTQKALNQIEILIQEIEKEIDIICLPEIGIEEIN